MKTSLYRVRVTTVREVVVCGEDECDAVKRTYDEMSMIMDNEPYTVKVSRPKRIASKEDLPGEYDGTCYPWGQKSDVLIGEWLQPD